MAANLQKIKDPLQAALAYAELGLAVVPIQKGTKRPPMKAWQEEASLDPDVIRSWWNRWPDSGVGVVTGKKSGGLAVIDLDEHPEDGRHGVELLENWQQENGQLPETWTAITGSGGRHLFFRIQEDLKRQQHLFDKQVDFQADGALIILPPTVHPKTGKPYKWAKAPDQLPLAAYEGRPAEFIDEGYLAMRGSQTNMVLNVVAFAILWIIIPIVLGLVPGRFMRRLVRPDMVVRPMHRVVGAVVSLAKYVVLISCIFNFMSGLNMLSRERVAQSFWYEPVTAVMASVMSHPASAAADSATEEEADTIWIDMTGPRKAPADTLTDKSHVR